MNDPIIIDTPDGIDHYRFAATIAALRLEVKGLKSRYKLLPIAHSLGATAKTKAGALAQLEDLYEAKYGRRYGTRP